MHQAGAFLQIPRRTTPPRPVTERVRDYREVARLPSQAATEEQALRCMSCGTPFCHWRCPLGNEIPLWNDQLANGQWHAAYRLLQATNNIPEITGRVCPALCESSCVLGLFDEPVTIRENELAIVERAFAEGWVQPQPPRRRTGKSVAIVGSGPAGLCCADQLNRAGHRVVVFEREAHIGGLLRYGIPDFKLEKPVLDRRLNIWRDEGIEFVPGTLVGRDYPVHKLRREFDAVCLAGGVKIPRDLDIPGRPLHGIHLAMEYLTQANRSLAGEPFAAEPIKALDRRVVVLGGGDTGADCVGTALRQGARHIVQIELLPQPPAARRRDAWPDLVPVLKPSTSHEEGAGRLEQLWSVLTKQFVGTNGRLQRLSCVRVEWSDAAGHGAQMREVPGSDFAIDADLVLLALGFLRPEHTGLLSDLGVDVEPRGTVHTDVSYMTSVNGVFAAGDMRRGQSLVVWAVAEGRRAAHFIDGYLMGQSHLRSGYG